MVSSVRTWRAIASGSRPTKRSAYASKPSIVSPEPTPTSPSSVSTRTTVAAKLARGTGSQAAENGGSSDRTSRSSLIAVMRTDSSIAPSGRHRAGGSLLVYRRGRSEEDHARRRTPRGDRRVRTHHQALRRERQERAGRGQRPVAVDPGREDLRAGRAIGLRQDDVVEDGQPAHRADLGADPDRRRGRRGSGRHGSPAEHRLRHPAGWALPPSDDRGERGHRAASPRLAAGASA